MPYLAIENFKGGLDKRRMELTADVGSLQVLKNAHISRGGEIEKALAFVEEYSLPAGTYGMAVIREQIYVFGSAVEPAGLDPDITYQRLQSPDNASMTAVVCIDAFAGKLYVVADFADGKRGHFYDGALIGDWYYGVVRASMTNNAGIAEHLRELIDVSPDYAGTRIGAVITITGASANAFTISALARNGEGNTFNDQTAAVATTQTAVAGQVEVLSVGSFRVTGGSPLPGTNRINAVTVDGVDIQGGPAEILATGSFTITGGAFVPGVDKIDTVTVNGVNILGAAVDHTGNNTTTALNVANQINSHSSTPEYTATNVGPVVTISAVAASGSSPNGFAVATTQSGGFTVGSINNMAGGAYSGIQWATSNSATATAIANRINAYTSSTEYTASASGDKVTLTALAGTGTAPNGRVVAVSVSGDVIASDITNMAGGIAAGSGQPQISTVTIGGTFEPNDLFSVTLASKVFGADRVSGLNVASTIKIHKNKVYAANKATLLFSGVSEPTKWKAEDTGSGAIDMSSQASGFEDITAISVYQNNLAIFSRNVTQIWFVDPDPDSNSQLQVLENIGTRSPRSVVGFGDSDVFFLSDTGIRSLKARDASNAAAVSDVGTPIDTIVVEHMATLTDAQIINAAGIIEPKDGRYILALDGIMYVFSYFASAKVSSWSTYERGITIDWFAKSGTKVYARSGDSILLLGGASQNEYDDTPVEVELPYIDANKLAHWKSWTAIDLAIEGSWTLYSNTDPNQPTVFELLGTIDKHTVNELNNAIQQFGPVFKLKLVNNTVGPAKIGNILIHYRDSKQT